MKSNLVRHISLSVSGVLFASVAVLPYIKRIPLLGIYELDLLDLSAFFGVLVSVFLSFVVIGAVGSLILRGSQINIGYMLSDGILLLLIGALSLTACVVVLNIENVGRTGGQVLQIGIYATPIALSVYFPALIGGGLGGSMLRLLLKNS